MNPDTPIDRFLTDLAGAVRCDDRGTLADLRHGVSEATCHRAWPHLAPYCDLRDPRARAIWSLIGAGYATLAPDNLARLNVGNIGATMRHLVLGNDKPDDKKLASFDGRFRRLLACQTVEELCEHLFTVVRASKAKNVAVDFRELYYDLTAWETQDVRVKWATAYWGVPPAAASKGDAA
jgi:CRISPR type I-E-associated protein CasB/Cse2